MACGEEMKKKEKEMMMIIKEEGKFVVIKCKHRRESTVSSK